MKYVFAWMAVVGLPVVVLGTFWFGRRDLRQPNVILPTQMAYSPAARGQSPDLPGVAPSQPTVAVAGTLPRHAHAFVYGKTAAERRRAGLELVNPIPETPEVLARGRRLYETFCLPCHGPTGNGDGPLIPKFPNPPSFRSKQTLALKDGEMFHTITVGRKKMASYASQLDWRERWEVIRYIRNLQAEARR